MFRNLSSATLNALKGEKCHLDLGRRVAVVQGEETYLQDRCAAPSCELAVGYFDPIDD